MESSQRSLPQLSSYLPSTAVDVQSATGMATADSDDNSMLPTKKRRNSIEGAFSASSPASPRHFGGDQRRRKQAGSVNFSLEEEASAIPYLRLDNMHAAQDQFPSSYSSTVYPASESPQPTTPRRQRTSRYLSEGDRREIITRIDNGEKQVTLAREFHVSRAAICNLYKNRWEVLTRGSRDPGAKHPKKSRGKKSSPRRVSAAEQSTTASTTPPSSYPDVSSISITSDLSDVETSVVADTKLASEHQDEPSQQQRQLGRDNLSEQHNQQACVVAHPGQFDELVGSPQPVKPFLVHEASAYSYPCRSLVATLRDVNTSTAVFQQRAMRLIRLLIEEVLTCLPHENVEIKTKYGDVCHATTTLDESDVCAVSMEDKGMVLLHAFSDICTTSPTGAISIDSGSSSAVGDQALGSRGDTLLPSRIHAQLPCIRPQQVVLLLDIQCATGEDACAVLRHLVHDKGIAEASIYFVTLISAFEGLQNVFRHFPDVTLITAQVDTVVDQQHRIRPGIGDFVKRYWGMQSEPSTSYAS